MEAVLVAAAALAAYPEHTASRIDATFTAAQSLTTLLTTESLLFAAFNAGIVLTAPSKGGRQITRTNSYRLAKASVAALGAVASAAAPAWWQVFGDHWPASALRALEGVGIAVGIVVQPVVAAIVVYANRPPRS